jgi:hypothetical protein
MNLNPFDRGSDLRQWGRNMDFTHSGSQFRQGLASWDPTRTPKYDAPEHYGLDKSGMDIQALIKQLGITPPEDTRAADKEAAFATLDQQGGEARAMSDRNYAARGSGAYRSGAARAGLDRINTGIATAKGNVGSAIDQNYSNQKRGYEVGLLNAALGNQSSRNNFNLGIGDRQYGYNEVNPFMARQDALAGGMNFGGKLLTLGMI